LKFQLSHPRVSVSALVAGAKYPSSMSELATILHIDMDAFYASVAAHDDPSLRGKALVVGAGIRGVVLSANYEARKFGIRAAMPVGHAKKMAPHAIFVAPDHQRYAEVSSHVMEIFQTFTPWVEPLSLDEAFLDVTGSRKLLGTGYEIGEAIREKVSSEIGITCSVGIAPSKFIAKIASDICKPDGILEIEASKILEFLHPLPIKKLWGVGPKTGEKLEQMGLRTIGDIAELPRTTLIRVLGQANGSSLYELAWGRDYRDVVVNAPEKSISNAQTFEKDIDDPEEILQELLRMTEKATSRLRAKGFFARTVSINIRFEDFTNIAKSKSLPLATSSTHEIYELVKELFLSLGIERQKVRMVGVGLTNLGDPIAQQLELGDREKGWRDAEKAIDRARARFGKSSVRPGRLIDEPDDS
jgi:DNA polymerase-4